MEVIGTKSELYMLLEEDRLWASQFEEVNAVLEETILKVQHVEKLLAIKGVGCVTIAGIIAEVGDIRRFKSPIKSKSMRTGTSREQLWKA